MTMANKNEHATSRTTKRNRSKMKIKRKLKFSRAEFESICAVDCLSTRDVFFCFVFSLFLAHYSPVFLTNSFHFILCCCIHNRVRVRVCAFAQYASVFIGSKGNIRIKYNVKLNLWPFMNAKCEFKRNFRSKWNLTPTITPVVRIQYTNTCWRHLFRQKVQNNCIQLMDVPLCVNG